MPLSITCHGYKREGVQTEEAEHIAVAGRDPDKFAPRRLPGYELHHHGVRRAGLRRVHAQASGYYGFGTASPSSS